MYNYRTLTHNLTRKETLADRVKSKAFRKAVSFLLSPKGERQAPPLKGEGVVSII